MDTTINMTNEDIQDMIQEESKNMEQSAKSTAGTRFNQYVTSVFKRLHNGKNMIFIKNEPAFAKGGTKQSWQCKPIMIKMDHSFLLVDDDKKEIIYVLSDNTTTYRKDRARGKCAEGINQSRLKVEIEADLFKRFPQYVDYNIAHANVFVFPSKMKHTLKNLVRECETIRTFCINTNYGTNEFRSNEGCHQIDAAMTIAELEEVIKEITKNPHKYSFTRDTIAHVWTKLFTSWDYQPLVNLEKRIVKKNKAHAIYCLQKAPREYSVAVLNSFAKECGLKFKKNTPKKAMVQSIVEHIHNHM